MLLHFCALTSSVNVFLGKSCYTVWSGPLVNKDQELFPVCLRSSTRPYLPFKLWVSLMLPFITSSMLLGFPVSDTQTYTSVTNLLVLTCRPEKLEVNRGMQLEQVKRKIPPVLFSWDTYSASREGQSGLHCLHLHTTLHSSGPAGRDYSYSVWRFSS